VTVRIDTGVFEGANISIHYDPMISKLCTHAETREKAIVAMESALDQYVVSGFVISVSFIICTFIFYINSLLTGLHLRVADFVSPLIVIH
jgi:acetyl/propionyl-CoA carboxylase alpha subunit